MDAKLICFAYYHIAWIKFLQTIGRQIQNTLCFIVMNSPQNSSWSYWSSIIPSKQGATNLKWLIIWQGNTYHLESFWQSNNVKNIGNKYVNKSKRREWWETWNRLLFQQMLYSLFNCGPLWYIVVITMWQKSASKEIRLRTESFIF